MDYNYLMYGKNIFHRVDMADEDITDLKELRKTTQHFVKQHCNNIKYCISYLVLVYALYT